MLAIHSKSCSSAITLSSFYWSIIAAEESVAHHHIPILHTAMPYVYIGIHMTIHAYIILYIDHIHMQARVTQNLCSATHPDYCSPVDKLDIFSHSVYTLVCSFCVTHSKKMDISLHVVKSKASCYTTWKGHTSAIASHASIAIFSKPGLALKISKHAAPQLWTLLP